MTALRPVIFGARGRLGGALVAACRRRGREPITPEVDITDPDAVRRCLAGPTVGPVINCAAFTAVDRAETEIARAFAVNGDGPGHLARATAARGLPLLHLSTDYVFAGDRTAPYPVDHPPAPINRYGASKLAGERQLLAHTERYYLVRLSWLFADRGPSFPRHILDRARTSSRLRAADDQVSCPTYASDLAPLLLALLDSERYGIYHQTNRGACSRYQWARALLAAAAPSVRVDPAPSRDFLTPARRPAYSVLDPSPIESIAAPLPDWTDATRRWLRAIGAVDDP